MSSDSPSNIRVLVVDDHALFRDGIVNVINNQSDMNVVGEAGDGLEALVQAQALRPDVILLDINMPGTNGLEAARLIAQAVPESHIVMLTVRDEDARIFEALRNGAIGYLPKTIRAHQLCDMIRTAAQGEAALTPAMAARVIASFRSSDEQATAPNPTPATQRSAASESRDELTSREQAILRLISAGLSDKEIATTLTISLYTVKSHVRNILSKLQVNNRRDAARRTQLE